MCMEYEIRNVHKIEYFMSIDRQQICGFSNWYWIYDILSTLNL